MRRIVVITLVVGVLAFAGQAKADWTVGGGALLYSTESGQGALQLEGAYHLRPWLRIGADIMGGGRTSRQALPDGHRLLPRDWQLNLNAQFVVAELTDHRFYTLAGFNLTRFDSIRVFLPGPEVVEQPGSTELGFNVGLGLELDRRWGAFFAEGKYTRIELDPQTLDQWAVGVGARFSLGRRSR